MEELKMNGAWYWVLQSLNEQKKVRVARRGSWKVIASSIMAAVAPGRARLG